LRGVDEDVGKEGIVEDADAAVEDGPSVGEEASVRYVGEADAWSDVVGVFFYPYVGVDGSKGVVEIDGRVGERVEWIGQVVVTQAEVDGEIRR
jgi:hypothetical protein